MCYFGEYPDHVVDCGFDEYLCWAFRIAGGGDALTSRYWDPVLWQAGSRADRPGEYGPDVYCDFLIDFMTRNAAGPFLAYYPMCLPHFPFEWPPGSSGAGTDEEKFAAMVAYMDLLVGRIVAALDGLGLRQKTLVLFTGDNGTDKRFTSDLNGEPYGGGKDTITDAGTRVPLVASWPGTVPGGRVVTDLVDFSDFMPTLAELAGADLPAGVRIDGVSFAPQLLGAEGRPRDWVYAQVRDDAFAREERWKLNTKGELYDMVADPGEAAPIAAGAGGAEAERARARLQWVLDNMDSWPLTRRTWLDSRLRERRAGALTDDAARADVGDYRGR
jgi:arylsulfatase A